jgi:bifunctional UDP-N-acetylglucosamine pyrophosphorylase / glucosamine-1-phosphate N-acetyltransferase
MKEPMDDVKIKQLINKGVIIKNPDAIAIGEDVCIDRISGDGVTLHAGSKIFGSKTLIMDGCAIGYETPATIDNCQIGANVKVRGGFISQSTLLKNVTVRSGADIREGCLLEEEVRCAHTVGLKQTVLFPFVTLGSLINFCDCFMSGGTGRKNHSEVGSSYIHFNYTPDQDKATPSLIGDVPNGVMLKQRPIFLGGQGGLVGPSRIWYGTVIAAGTIYRKDFLKGDGMLFSGANIRRKQPLYPDLYQGIKRIIYNNINYIANIITLHRWYMDIRYLFFGAGKMNMALFKGATEKIGMIIAERIRRLTELSEKMPRSLKVYKEVMKGNALQKQEQLRLDFYKQWPSIEQFLDDCYKKEGDLQKRDRFIDLVQKGIEKNGKDYIEVITHLENSEANLGAEWLQGLVDEINNKALGFIPSFRS